MKKIKCKPTCRDSDQSANQKGIKMICELNWIESLIVFILMKACYIAKVLE